MIRQTRPDTADAEIRLWIYQHFIENRPRAEPGRDRCVFRAHTGRGRASARRLQDEADALVLLPGSSYIWMAEPFSAAPTSFTVRSGGRVWWGNCIWDALGILALVGTDGAVSTACPHSGQPLLVAVSERGLEDPQGIVHFAIPAREWWRDIGVT